MKSRLALIALVWLAAFAWARWALAASLNIGTATFGSPTVAAAWNPTNSTDGSYPVAFYDPDLYSTNTGVAYLYDRTTNAVHLTNSTASGDSPLGVAAGLNGHQILRFTAAEESFLNCDFITNVQPFTLVLLMNNKIATASAPYFYDGLDDNKNLFSYAGGAGDHIIYLGSAATYLSSKVAPLTNQWVVYTTHWDGNNSYIATNLVQITNGPASTETMTGFIVGLRGNKTGARADMDIGPWLIYTNASTTTISNAYSWLTNWGGL